LAELGKVVSKASFVKGVVWSTAGSWSGQIIGFATFALLAIFLGPKAYGLMAMAMVIAAVSEVLIVGGLAEALVQRQRLEPAHIDSVFWLLVGLGATLAILAQLFADGIAAAFGEPLVARMIRWLSVLPLLHALSAVPLALLMRNMRFDLLMLRTILGLTLGGAVGIGMALSGFGPWSLVGLQLTQQGVIVLSLWLTSGWRPHSGVSLRHLRDLLAFGSQIIGLKLVVLAEQQLIRIVVGAWLGPAALGFFHMGWRLIEVLRLSLLVPLANTAMPAFSRMQTDLVQVRTALLGGVRFSALVGLPSYLGFAAVAPDLIPLLFGEQWAGSVRVTQILALLGGVWSLTILYGAAMRGLGRPMMQLAPQFLGVILLALMLLAFARRGVEAVAWCMLVQALLVLPLTAHLAHRLTGLRLVALLRGGLPALGAAVVMTAAVIGWRSAMDGTLNNAALLVSEVAVGVIVYAACVLVLDRRIAREILDLAMTAATRRSATGADS